MRVLSRFALVVLVFISGLLQSSARPTIINEYGPQIGSLLGELFYSSRIIDMSQNGWIVVTNLEGMLTHLDSTVYREFIDLENILNDPKMRQSDVRLRGLPTLTSEVIDFFARLRRSQEASPVVVMVSDAARRKAESAALWRGRMEYWGARHEKNLGSVVSLSDDPLGKFFLLFL
jgi:hypothetical protein